MTERLYDLETTFEGNTFVTTNLPYPLVYQLAIQKIVDGCWPVVVRPLDKPQIRTIGS